MGESWTREEKEFLKQLEKRKVSIYQVYCELKRAGFNRTYKAVESKVRDMILNGELTPKIDRPQRIGYLDIETTNLNADFGFMLTWAIKDRDTDKVFCDCIRKQEIFSYHFDRRIVASLAATLRKFDTVVTYYGTKFDLPFVRTRALYHNIDFPSYGQLHTIDLYYAVRDKLKLRSSRLSVASQYLALPGKTPVDPHHWLRAQFGDPKALKYVLEHNIQDVRITEQLHLKLEGFMKGVIRSV